MSTAIRLVDAATTAALTFTRRQLNASCRRRRPRLLTISSILLLLVVVGFSANRFLAPLIWCDGRWVDDRIEAALGASRQDVEEFNQRSPTEWMWTSELMMLFAADELVGANSIQCLGDCAKLRDLFKTSWPPDKPKAVIYYLIEGKRYRTLRQSLATLQIRFNDRFRYPVIIFYNETDPDVDKTWIRSLVSNGDVFFQPVTFKLPSFIDERSVPEHGCLSRFPLEYRHMCRFQAVGIYEQPIMSPEVGIEYAWRLDDDSLLLRPITFDIFELMRDRRLLYGYLHTNVDNRHCVCGLWEAADAYIARRRVIPTFYDDWPRRRIFYNNFEVSSVDVWRSPEYQAYVRFVDRLGGIYLRRWGDAPIKTIAVSMFVERNRTFVFRNIAYEHQGLVIDPGM